MAVTRRTKHLRTRKALIFEALVETHLSSYSISKILTSVSQLVKIEIVYISGQFADGDTIYIYIYMGTPPSA